MNVVSFLKRGCKEQKVSGQKIIVETEAGQAEASQFRSPKMVAVAPPELCATSRQMQSCSG
ncbi:MAG: hypothetical protein EOS21_22770 [Mesorhizobium sp.]|nr:MAG: hypothetical protein EOS21_22770 [Mesorhizobium sp.]